jgi:hypothetical protein
MKNFSKYLDSVVEKALNEALESKADKIVSEIQKKMETTEKLHGKQSKLDVAEPKGKIDAADFRLLRKKKSVKEYTMGDDDLEGVEGYGDFSTDSPNITPKGNKEVKNVGYKYAHKVAKEFDEQDETTEGNAFSGALATAKKEGKKSFKVGKKSFPVEESVIEEKWKGDVDVKKTGQYSKMTISQIDDEIKKLKDKNEKTKEKDTKVSDKDKTKMSQLYFAKRAKKDWPGKGKSKVSENFQLTEEEIVNLIEILVKEQKTNIQKKKSTAQTDLNKVEKSNKEINDSHIDDVVKKMKTYLKDQSKGDYSMNPENFPQGNGELGEMKKKAYVGSDAVEEYIEDFAYPGMTNLVYDEIKPNDEWIEANIKGSSKTGNATKDKDGNALGNVVPSELGEKMYKNFKDNVYGAEQMNASYKRYPQPVDQAGEETEDGSLALKKGAKKSQDLFKKLESVEKSDEILKEEIYKMKTLVQYNKKTQ